MKPILFNTEMVRAILEGRKTVTRRVVKPQPLDKPMCFHDPEEGLNIVCHVAGMDVLYNFFPPYQPGDILWVRETWCESMGQAGKYFYRAYAGPRDEMKEYAHSFNRWHPSIHMPKEAARIILRVKGVRVERLKDITPEQIDAEGCKEWAYSATTGELLPSGPSWFVIAWDNTLKPADRALYGWEANPWVFVIEFERISKDEALGGGGDAN